jgi:hypothetical protein
VAHHVIHGDETNSVAVRAMTDITGPAGGFASVASDPERTLGTANCRIAKGLLDHLVGSGEDRLRKPAAAQSAAATVNCHSSWQILEVQIHADLIA